MPNRTLILNAEKVQQKITRIAYQIYESQSTEREIVLVGVAKRGYLLAQRLAGIVQKISPLKVQLVELSMNKQNVHEGATLSCDASELNGKSVILIDDVLNSGEVLMFAAKHLLGIKLKKLSTVVLVDRRHRSFPIRADFVGLTLSTTLQEHISVEFDPKGKQDMVYLR